MHRKSMRMWPAFLPAVVLATLPQTPSGWAQGPGSSGAEYGGAGSVLLVDPVASGSGYEFGATFTVGDYDDDGIDDLVIGSPGRNVNGHNAGRAFVYFGSPEGPVFSNSLDLGIGGARSAAALATGRFSSQTGDHLAIGVPKIAQGGTAQSGAVQIAEFSAASGTVLATTPLLVAPNPTVGDLFGSALAVGDFDDDGWDDLAIGMPGRDVTAGSPTPTLREEAGAIAIAYGSELGLQMPLVADVFTREDFALDSSQAGERFGSVLVAGDFDGDGDDDLAIGSPLRDVDPGTGPVVDAGEVLLMEGSAGGLLPVATSFVLTDFDVALGTHTARFGASLAAGDLDRAACNPDLSDCREDLAIGAPWQPLGGSDVVGAVVIVPGSATGLTTSGSLVLHQPDLAGGHAGIVGDEFGHRVAIAPVDEHTGADLLITTIWDDLPNEGTVHLISGSSNLVDPASSHDVVMTAAPAITNQRYGSALAVGDFDDNGLEDLAIGASNYANPPEAGPGWGAVEIQFTGVLFSDGFESGGLGAWSTSSP